MDENDDGSELFFDEVYWPDLIETWAKAHYDEGVTVDRWYADTSKEFLVIVCLVQPEQVE